MSNFPVHGPLFPAPSAPVYPPLLAVDVQSYEALCVCGRLIGWMTVRAIPANHLGDHTGFMQARPGPCPCAPQ